MRAGSGRWRRQGFRSLAETSTAAGSAAFIQEGSPTGREDAGNDVWDRDRGPVKPAVRGAQNRGEGFGAPRTAQEGTAGDP